MERLAAWASAPPPRLSAAAEDNPPLSKEVRDLQRRMSRLLAKQKAKGGVIDVEKEEKKFLVATNVAVSTEEDDANEEIDGEGAKAATPVPTPPVSPVKAPMKEDIPDTSQPQSKGRDDRRRWKGGGGGGGRGRGHYSHRQNPNWNQPRRSHHDKYQQQPSTEPSSSQPAESKSSENGKRENRGGRGRSKRGGKGRGGGGGGGGEHNRQRQNGGGGGANPEVL